jgi:flagellar biosynthesis protein
MSDEHDFLHVDITEGASTPSPKGVSKAVAVAYDRATDEAPRITATGKGYVADQILGLAFAHGVRVREDAELVEILSLLEVDSLIPLEAFTAVAEILSYVYQANTLYGKPTHS